MLVAFLEKHLKVEIDTRGMFTITANDRRYREFVGKVISRIVSPVFEIISNEARRLNLYTYEIAYTSKASKIFTRKSLDFEDEDILYAEVLAYFVSANAQGANSRLLWDLVNPMPFDPALEADYMGALRSDRRKLAVLDELDSHYEDLEGSSKDRLDLLDAATSEHLPYGDDDDVDD